MTNEEKAIKVAELLKPEVVETASVLPFVELAGAVILNRLYPFGELGDENVPPRYDHIQCMIAVDLWNKRGAEGQTSHSENGITRTWASSHVSPNLLRLIVPSVGSVV
jgi:hypothetical protein